MAWHRYISAILAGVAVMVAGCSQASKRILPPPIDPVQAADEAIKQYDADGNGELEGNELNMVPAIKTAIDLIDTNKDGSVSREEIAGRIRTWQASRVGIMAMPVKVSLDGGPLAGVDVVIIPERFLGPAVRPASGTTDDSGIAMLTVDDPDLKAQRLTGVAPGYYRVTVTGGSGTKKAPTRYGDEQSPLGVEVAQDAPWAPEFLRLELTGTL